MNIPLFNIKLDIKPNPLDALLATLGARLAYLQKHKNADFVKLTDNKTLVLQFLSDDGVARFFEFNQGFFIQNLGTHPKPDLSISFKDSKTGVKLLARADTRRLMTAVQDGDLTVVGDFKLVLWFASLVKVATRLPDSTKEHLATAQSYWIKAEGLVKGVLDKIKRS